MEFWHNQLQCNLIFEFAWLYNIFQQQSMLVKPVGTLVKHHHQSNQIFHQTHKIIPQYQTLTVNEPKPQNTKSQSNRKRANSVGKIYNRKSSTNKENTDLPMNTYDRLINYNEVQNKLSKFMQCTINTTQKPKYNYLFQHYNHVNIYQPKYNTHFQYNGAPLRQNSQQLLNKNPSNCRSIQRRQSHKNIIQNNNIPYKQAKNHFNSLQNSRKQLKQPNGGQKRMPLALIQAKLQIKPQRKIQKTKQKYNERPPSPKIDKKMTASQQKSQKKIQKKDCQSKKYEMVGSNKQNHIPLSNAPINKRQMIPLGNRKQNLYNMSGFIHQQHKNQLQMKLKKMINSYQTKNKQLSFEMHKIQQKIGNVKNIEENKVKNIQQNKPFEDLKPEDPPFKQNSLTQAIEKLIEYNLKGISLSKQIDDKLQQTWRSIHKQILVDQNLRIIKCFINESNINTILNQINDNRVKKIEISVLKTHSEEYDPFLLEKLNQILKISNQDFTNKLVIKWISEIFVKYYEESQRNWIKNLSQQKIECFIKNILLQKQINGLRKNEALSKDLNIRDFTRYLSILFKANLRNRNVYQIHNKLKGMTFIGRFIELLQQKAGKGSSCKKSLPMPK